MNDVRVNLPSNAGPPRVVLPPGEGFCIPMSLRGVLSALQSKDAEAISLRLAPQCAFANGRLLQSQRTLLRNDTRREEPC